MQLPSKAHPSYSQDLISQVRQLWYLELSNLLKEPHWESGWIASDCYNSQWLPHLDLTQLRATVLPKAPDFQEKSPQSSTWPLAGWHRARWCRPFCLSSRCPRVPPPPVGLEAVDRLQLPGRQGHWRYAVYTITNPVSRQMGLLQVSSFSQSMFSFRSIDSMSFSGRRPPGTIFRTTRGHRSCVLGCSSGPWRKILQG